MSVKNMANVSSQPLMETSTPMNAKREIRVRFAPHPEESQNGDTCLDYLNSNDRNSECLPVSSPQVSGVCVGMLVHVFFHVVL